MLNKLLRKKNTSVASGHQVTLQELIAIRSKIHPFSEQSKRKSYQLFSGGHITQIRGRGIEFDSTRDYQPGDDIRRMAWRLTARSLKPHVKVYHEDKERPVWLGVDLSPSLYFGTRCCFKSVRSIKQAALLGWSYLHQRERIGAVIANTQSTRIYRPRAREREFLGILKTLAEVSLVYPAFTEPNNLHRLLSSLQEHIRSGNLLFLLSDFYQFDRPEQQMIVSIAKKAQVILMFIYDPLEAEAPAAYQYLLTDGQGIARFNMESRHNRDHYQEQFQQKLNALLIFARHHHIQLHVLRTDEEHEMSIKS